MRGSTQESNIKHLTSLMQARFGGGACDGEMIAREVRTEYERLCRESKVTQFVPMLAERRVRRHLAKRCDPSADVRAGVEVERLEEDMTGDG
jgi:hypothetical protein